MYHPLLNKDNITALIVWDALNTTQAGGIVNHYDVFIQDLQTDEVRVCKYNNVFSLVLLSCEVKLSCNSAWY